MKFKFRLVYETPIFQFTDNVQFARRKKNVENPKQTKTLVNLSTP